MEAFKGEVSTEFKLITHFQNKTEDKLEEIKETLQSNKEDREELAKRQFNLDSRVTDVQEGLTEEIANNFKQLWSFTEDVEKQLTATLEV